jgi:hypothetical protein
MRAVWGSLLRGRESVTDARHVPLPSNYRWTVDGIEPEFDYLTLVLHADGSVTWLRLPTNGDE